MRLVTVYPIKRQRWRPGKGRKPQEHRDNTNGRQPERNQTFGVTLRPFAARPEVIVFGPRANLNRILLSRSVLCPQ